MYYPPGLALTLGVWAWEGSEGWQEDPVETGLCHGSCAIGFGAGQKEDHKWLGPGVHNEATSACPPVQLRAFVSTLHFPPAGSTLLKMTNNFRPPQPLHGRKVFASRAATASSGSPCGGHHQLLSPLLLLALLAPLSPAL